MGIDTPANCDDNSNRGSEEGQHHQALEDLLS